MTFELRILFDGESFHATATVDKYDERAAYCALLLRALADIVKRPQVIVSAFDTSPAELAREVVITAPLPPVEGLN